MHTFLKMEDSVALGCMLLFVQAAGDKQTEESEIT